jgi:hypothetical protein
MARAKCTPKDSTANLGFEAKLWLAADKLRNNMDAAEYKHVVLGLIFLKTFQIPSRSTAPSSSRARVTARDPIPRTQTNTVPKMSSGCPRRHAGPTFRRAKLLAGFGLANGSMSSNQSGEGVGIN